MIARQAFKLKLKDRGFNWLDEQTYYDPKRE